MAVMKRHLFAPDVNDTKAMAAKEDAAVDQLPPAVTRKKQ